MIQPRTETELRLYPISTESVSPDNIRSGINTEIVAVHTQPGRTNLRNKPLRTGWLGTTNDVYCYALGEFMTTTDLYTFLQNAGYIPLRDACEHDRTNAKYCCEDLANITDPVWVPAIRQYAQIANVLGNDALDAWLYDVRGEIIQDIQRLICAGASYDDAAQTVADQLECEANAEGYTLVKLDKYLAALWDGTQDND